MDFSFVHERTCIARGQVFATRMAMLVRVWHAAASSRAARAPFFDGFDVGLQNGLQALPVCMI